MKWDLQMIAIGVPVLAMAWILTRALLPGRQIPGKRPEPDWDVKFPLRLVDENGEESVYGDIGDLQCDLECYDSDHEPVSVLTDALGRRVRLKMLLMSIEVLEIAEEPLNGSEE